MNLRNAALWDTEWVGQISDSIMAFDSSYLTFVNCGQFALSIYKLKTLKMRIWSGCLLLKTSISCFTFTLSFRSFCNHWRYFHLPPGFCCSFHSYCLLFFSNFFSLSIYILNCSFCFVIHKIMNPVLDGWLIRYIIGFSLYPLLKLCVYHYICIAFSHFYFIFVFLYTLFLFF